MLFLDLCEAFYRIVRQLSIGGPVPDEVIARMGQRLGLTPDILHELYQHLHEAPATMRAGLPQWQQKVIQSVHTDTHFHVSGQPDVCQTHLGTRPGDCYADIVFSFLWARLLRSLESELHAQGLLECIPPAEGFYLDASSSVEVREGIPYLGPTWMDDTCLCLAASSPEEIVRISSQAASLLLHKCECFAMTPNLSAGKSELMLVFQGQGARKARLQYFGPAAAPGLPIVTDGGVKTLTVVTSYTHLGCTIHHKGDVRREVRRRFAIAHTAFNVHRRLLFQNRSLEIAKRVELFRTLILSKLLYGAESWVLHEAKMKQYIHVALIRLYKRLIRGNTEHLSDMDVLWFTGLPDPADLLRQCRLRHLGGLYNCGPAAEWGLLNQDTMWCNLVRSDLEWMWQQLGNASTLPDPLAHFGDWVYLMQNHRGYWKRLVRRAVDHASAQRRNHYIVERFHRDILTTLHGHGFLHLAPPYEVRDTGEVSSRLYAMWFLFQESRRLWCSPFSSSWSSEPGSIAFQHHTMWELSPGVPHLWQIEDSSSLCTPMQTRTDQSQTFCWACSWSGLSHQHRARVQA